MALEKLVDRRQIFVPELLRLAARIEPAQQRRQQRDAGEEGDQHADAGDQAEFGKPAIGGRQERQETGRGRQRRKRQRRAGAPPGMQQRLVQTVDLVALRAITHAVLDAEVDPQPDKQHGEVNRDQVEGADHQDAERRRDRKPDRKRDEHRQDDLPPSQRQPHDEEHDRDGQKGIEPCIFLDGGELVVVHRHGAGEADARLILGRQIEIGNRLANRVARPHARLQLGIIHHRLDFHEAQQIGGFCRTSLSQDLPGKARRLVGIHLLDGFGCLRQRPDHIVERQAAGLHAEQAVLQGLDHAAQARIAGQHLDQPLRLRQHRRLLLELFGRHEQQAVLGEERIALRLVHGDEVVLLGL